MRVMQLLVVLMGLASMTVTRPAEAAQDVAFPLAKMQDVLGQSVTTSQGKEVGRIENVILDAATGDALYVVVTSGGVVGLGSTLRTLPWGVVQAAADRQAFQLQIEAETFTRAPHFDPDSWPDMEDRHWVDAIQVYYGRAPRLGPRLPADTSEPVAQGPRPVLRAKSVVQGQVMNPQGQRLGEIEDVVLDVTTGKVAYAVLAFKRFPRPGEKWFALPWQALKQSKGLGTFLLAVEAQVLDAAPGFDRDRWPQQAQPLGGVGR